MVTFVVTALASTAAAEPRVGEAFPPFTARDLREVTHSHQEFAGRRTLIVAMSGTGAGDAVRAWVDAATARLPQGAQSVVTVVALNLPFFATDGLVRSRARDGAPVGRWTYTWLDRGGDLQQALGLPDGSSTPWAFVVDARGRVIAAAHAPASAPAAAPVWNAMTDVMATRR